MKKNNQIMIFRFGSLSRPLNRSTMCYSNITKACAFPRGKDKDESESAQVLDVMHNMDSRKVSTAHAKTLMCEKPIYTYS